MAERDTIEPPADRATVQIQEPRCFVTHRTPVDLSNFINGLNFWIVEHCHLDAQDEADGRVAEERFGVSLLPQHY